MNQSKQSNLIQLTIHSIYIYMYVYIKLDNPKSKGSYGNRKYNFFLKLIVHSFIRTRVQ